ncbi:MAG: Sec-independent protein translocase protein TatB [bacterium]
MFEAGFLEMLLIGVIGLLVIGPERLPKVARQIGTWIGKLRRFVSTTKQDLERELHADEMRNMLIMQEEKIRELQNSIKENTDSIKQELSQDVNHLRESLDDAKNAAQGNHAPTQATPSDNAPAATHETSEHPTPQASASVVLDKPTQTAQPTVTLDKPSPTTHTSAPKEQAASPKSPTA